MHQNQTNDFDLGIHPYPDGIFWTVRMPDRVAEADMDDGTASYRAKGLKTPDYGSIGNALAGGPFVPARSSFDVEWGGPAVPTSWSTSDYTFHGMQTQATISWSASEAGSTWKSDSTGQTVESAFVGIDRNGVFR